MYSVFAIVDWVREVRLEKDWTRQNTIVSTSWRLVTENCKYFFIEFKFVWICKNIRVRLVKYTCSLLIELTLGWFSKKLQAELPYTLQHTGWVDSVLETDGGLYRPIIWAVNDLWLDFWTFNWFLWQPKLVCFGELNTCIETNAFSRMFGKLPGAMIDY